MPWLEARKAVKNEKSCKILIQIQIQGICVRKRYALIFEIMVGRIQSLECMDRLKNEKPLRYQLGFNIGSRRKTTCRIQHRPQSVT